jgi:hypothetical protein
VDFEAGKRSTLNDAAQLLQSGSSAPCLSTGQICRRRIFFPAGIDELRSLSWMMHASAVTRD